MDMRLTFNEVASEYDRMRQRYVRGLFYDTLLYSAVGKGRRALEIGSGTGQAIGARPQTGQIGRAHV